MRLQLRRCPGCGGEREFPAGQDRHAQCVPCGRIVEWAPVCAFEECRVELGAVPNLRRDARFCAPAHKTKAWKVRSGYEERRRAAKASPVGGEPA